MTPQDAQTETSKIDLSMSMLTANLVGLVLVPVLATLVLGPHWLIWGGETFLNGVLGLFRPALVLSVLIISVIIHEALHGVGFIWIGRQPWQAVRFGFQWKTLTPYAHCKNPLSASTLFASHDDIQVFTPG